MQPLNQNVALNPDPVRAAAIEALIEAQKLKPTKRPNRFVHNIDGTTTIFLERRSGEVIECLIDTDKYDLVKNFRWCATKDKKTFYAQANIYLPGKQTVIKMHQLFLPGHKEIDHRGRNGCINLFSELRPATSEGNNANQGIRDNNSSGYIGVSWHKRAKKFLARAKRKGKQFQLGSFDDPIDAAKVYDAFVLANRGEFAVINFPYPVEEKKAA